MCVWSEIGLNACAQRLKSGEHTFPGSDADGGEADSGARLATQARAAAALRAAFRERGLGRPLLTRRSASIAGPGRLSIDRARELVEGSWREPAAIAMQSVRAA